MIIISTKLKLYNNATKGAESALINFAALCKQWASNLITQKLNARHMDTRITAPKILCYH